MKHLTTKVWLTTYMVVLCLTTAFAQGSHWDLTGNSITTGDVLGTTNAEDIVIISDAIERARILSTGEIGIGTASPFPDSRLHALNSFNNSLNVCLVGQSNGSSGSINLGVVGLAENGIDENRAIVGNAETTGGGSNVNVAVTGIADNSNYENNGASFQAFAGGSGINYGISASIDVGSPMGSYAGYFNGDIYCGGTVYPSDRNLKLNIENFSGRSAVGIIKELEVKTYNFDLDKYPYINLPKGVQYGLISQEVEKVVPEMVKLVITPQAFDKKGNRVGEKVSFKGINYTGFVPILLSGVKEQQQMIETLNEKIAQLEAKLDKLQGAVNPSANESNVTLNGAGIVVLEQNIPNPFADQTIIPYTVPADADNAKIVFYDVNGKLLNEVKVDKGAGRLTVFAGDISAGRYQYALIVDGKQVYTKSMIKQ